MAPRFRIRRWLSPTLFALIAGAGLCLILFPATVARAETSTSSTGKQLVTQTVPHRGVVDNAVCSGEISDSVERGGSTKMTVARQNKDSVGSGEESSIEVKLDARDLWTALRPVLLAGYEFGGTHMRALALFLVVLVVVGIFVLRLVSKARSRRQKDVPAARLRSVQG